MGVSIAAERIDDASPRFKARMGGLFWLLTALVGTLALVIPGAATNLVATACYVAATLFVYAVLRPVNRNLSLLAACSSVLGCSIGVLNSIISLVPSGMPFVFFGVHCFLVGYLILRSTFLPRLVGWLMMFGGLGWLTFSLVNLLSLPLGRSASPVLMIPGILGEVSLTLWLLVMGVNVQRWYEQAGAAEVRS
jgi:hypothetical protein